MFTKIKEFLFGKDTVQSPVAAPYKVESEPKVEVVPAGTEASMAAPVAEKPKAPPKPKALPKPKAPPKPRTPRKPVAK